MLEEDGRVNVNKGEDDDGCLKFCNILKWIATVQRKLLKGCLESTVRYDSIYTCMNRGDPDIRGPVFIRKKKSDFKPISFKKNQKIPVSNSKRKLQNMVKRKMTRTKLEIFC